MDRQVLKVAEDQNVDIVALQVAFGEAEREIAAFRGALIEALDPDQNQGIDVVLCGSFARREITRESDCDYLVVIEDTPDPKLVPEFIRQIDAIRGERIFSEPGQQGIFGEFVSAAELLGRIGLEADSNMTTTRRLLFLTESVSVYAPDIRSKIIDLVLERYCSDYDSDDRPDLTHIRTPRFLCNDIVRFWRTMAVDFGAKRWKASSPDWYLRFAKLVTTRKILFAGTLASIFLTDFVLKESYEEPHPHPRLIRHLKNHFDRPPLARLLSCYEHVTPDTKESLGKVLQRYSEFIGILNDRGSRNLLKKGFDQESQRLQALRGKIEAIAQSIQEGLEQIFFREPLFLPLTQRYGLF